MAENKVRSPSKEKALDTRIAEIHLRQLRNEERQKIVQTEAKTVRPTKVKDEEASTEKTKDAPKTNENKKGQAQREWDKGKSPAAEWKTNVPEMKERHRGVKQQPSTSRRNRNKRQDLNKPASGFQHDDRFEEKPTIVDKEKTPDENRKPSGNQRGPKPFVKRQIFSRFTRTNPKGDAALLFQKRAPNHQLGNRIRRPNPQTSNDKTQEESQPNADQSNRQNRRRRFPNKKDTQNNQTEGQVAPKQRPQRRPKQPNQSEPQSTDNKQKRRTPRIRVNHRPIPDHVQVRQTVRKLVGLVCMKERREKLGLPEVEKESEV